MTALMCRHGRQLTICAECAPEAERRYAEARKQDGFAAPDAAAPEREEMSVEDVARLHTPWSVIRLLLSQGSTIQQDYANGCYQSYEMFSARLDAAARERVELVTAVFRNALATPAPRAETTLREALAFYADPGTYEMVDLLGRCGLTDDKDENGDFGKQARAALATPAARAELPLREAASDVMREVVRQVAKQACYSYAAKDCGHCSPCQARAALASRPAATGDALTPLEREAWAYAITLGFRSDADARYLGVLADLVTRLLAPARRVPFPAEGEGKL